MSHKKKAKPAKPMTPNAIQGSRLTVTIAFVNKTLPTSAIIFSPFPPLKLSCLKNRNTGLESKPLSLS